MGYNLTGGNNVVNSALQIAASLSGKVARMYYVQAENKLAEKCVRYTAEDGYWIEIPVLPLTIDPISRAIIEHLKDKPIPLKEIYSRTSVEYYNQLKRENIRNEREFRDLCLAPLWKARLIVEIDGKYTVGPQWEVIKPYQEILEQAKTKKVSIEQLSRQEKWIEMEKLSFKQ